MTTAMKRLTVEQRFNLIIFYVESEYMYSTQLDKDGNVPLMLRYEYCKEKYPDKASKPPDVKIIRKYVKKWQRGESIEDKPSPDNDR